MAVKLVEHHVRHGVALDLDDDAHAVAVGFVAQVGDALDLLLAHELRDLLDQRRLVHLIRDLGDDDRLALLADLLHLGLGPHDDGAAARGVGRLHASAAEDHAAGREVRTGNDLDQLFGRDVGILHEGQATVDDLAQVVGRHVGGHADRDAAGAVDEEVREPGGQNRRFVLRLVVVRVEVDRVLVDILEQRHRRAGEAGLGIAHGRRRVAVHRAEVTLPVHQQHAQREVLRHAHQGVVDRLVAVRVILTHHVTDDAGRLHVLLVGRVAALVHGVENAAMHGLEAVAGVRESAAHDHAHGVIEIGALHLVDDGDQLDVARGLVPSGAAGADIVRIGQNGSFLLRLEPRAGTGRNCRTVKPLAAYANPSEINSLDGRSATIFQGISRVFQSPERPFPRPEGHISGKRHCSQALGFRFRFRE